MRMVSEIDSDNLAGSAALLGQETVQNLTRAYYSGLGVFEENENAPHSAMVWRTVNSECMGDTESELVFFSASDHEAGEDLLREYTKYTSYSNIKRSFFECKALPELSERLLSESGFEITVKESRDIVVVLGEIPEEKFTKKRMVRNVRLLKELSELQFKQGIFNCVFNDYTGLMEDLAFLPREWYEEDVSVCLLTDNKVDGLFLIRRTIGDELMPVLLFSTGIGSNTDVFEMLCAAYAAAAKKYPGDTRIRIRRENDKTMRMAAHYFPDISGERAVYGERNERG